MIPVDDVLEALDLSRAEPGTGFLEALYLRFNAKVPFENASKILRDEEIADPAQKPRVPEVFWADHLAHGTGGTCFARVAAFDALLTALGFQTRRQLGKVRNDYDHSSLAVATAAGESIVDVGFSLPALLRSGQEFVETAVGAMRVSQTGRGIRVAFEGGVPDGPRAVEIFAAPLSPGEYDAHWRRTFQPPAVFLLEVALRADRGNRVVSFARGEVRVDDLHSRLRVPIAKGRPAALAEIFGIDADVLARAMALRPDPEPSSADASIAAYLEVDAPADAAYGAIGSAAGYRRLVEGVAEVTGEERISGGFRLSLSAAGAAGPPLEEEILPDAASRRLAITRRGGTSESRSSYRAEKREGKTWLVRDVVLAGAREDLLRNDSLRGRLAGTLAVDLLAWARML